MKKFTPAILVAAGMLLYGCGAEPTASDVDRVRNRFLSLRFSAPMTPAIRGQSDQELFELSCRQLRVNCPRVLELLKESDPDFYAKLRGSKPEAPK